MRPSVLAAALMTALAPQAADPVADPVKEVIAAERAFAAKASATTTKIAFLEFLAPDSIMFRPGPVNGIEWWNAHPGRPGKLQWGPDFVIVASSGDVALSSGPWRFLDGEGKAVAFGHFATIWEKQADGSWKAKLDTGIGHDEMQVPAVDAPIKRRGAPKSNVSTGTAKITLETIHAHEKHKWLGYKRLHREPKFTEVQMLSRDVRLLRDERFPFEGRRAAHEHGYPYASFSPQGGGLSKAGDFAWSWGEYLDANSPNPDRQGHYLHVWQPVGSEWRIVFAIYTPTPPAPPPAPESAPSPGAPQS